MTTSSSPNEFRTLRQSMGIPTLVFFGLSYMVPMTVFTLSLIHISEPTRRLRGSRMPSSA